MTTKICPVCGKEFKPSRHEGVYCSRQCSADTRRGVYSVPRQSRICAHCGKEYGSDRKPSRTDNQLYCSHACFLASKIETRSCPACGKEFVTSIAKPTTYCSHRCSSIGKVKQVDLTCPVCGKDFKRPPCRGQKFCSKACELASHVDVGKYCNRGANWRIQRKAAYQRDGGKCRICGRVQKKGETRIISVHHIRKYREFGGDFIAANDLRNLITLCLKCHIRVEDYGYPCPQPLL